MSWAERLAAGVDLEDLRGGRCMSGGGTKTWRSKRPGRSSALSSFSSRFEAAITTTLSRASKPSISTSSWLSVWSRSPEMSEPRWRADGVELVDEDDRRSVLARLLEQAPDPRGAEAGEHLDERGGRLAEELRAGLVGDRLGEQRLAGPGRAVEQDALRDRRAEPLEALRVGEELDDLAQLVLGLVDAGDVVPGDRASSSAALISCGFVRGISRSIRHMK